MPISIGDAQRVANRLSAVPGSPKTEEASTALLKLLTERLTPDTEHQGAFVAHILEGYDFFPSPKALIEISRQTAPERGKRFGCSECDYTGFVETTITLYGRTAPASYPCDCRQHPEPDPEEWSPRENPEGTVGPVSAQVQITRDWADKLVADLKSGVKSL